MTADAFTAGDARVLLSALEDMQVRVTFYPTESVYNVVLQESIPAQIRQLILNHPQYEESVDGFVRESTFAKRLHTNTVCEIHGGGRAPGAVGPR